jgi:hypothetical protein
MLTTPDLRDDELRPWLAKAEGLIANRLADAKAHAQAGDVLIAMSRINELRTAIADDRPGEPSLLAHARATFYHAAFVAEPFDGSVHRPVTPNVEGELVARTAAIGGRNQYVDLRPIFDQAAMSLRALGDAAKAAAPGNESFWEDAFAVWLKRTTRTITARVNTALSDAQMSLSEAVSRVRIKPELM